MTGGDTRRPDRKLTIACALDADIWKQVAAGKPACDRAKCDLDVVRALRRRYFAVSLFPVGNRPAREIEAIQSAGADVLFNLALSATEQEPAFAGCLEFLGIPYTGSGPLGIALANDKVRSRELLRAADVRVPRFVELSIGETMKPLDLTPPVIVKPSRLGGCSNGIYRDSVVNTHEAVWSRARRIWKRFDVSAVCDEFVVGREFRVGIVEDVAYRRFQIVGVSESRFPGATPGWGFKNHGVRVNPRARQAQRVTSIVARLSRRVTADLGATANTALRVLSVRGYATIDVRMDEFGRITIIEVNANPGLSRRAIPLSRPSFSAVLDRIVLAAIAR